MTIREVGRLLKESEGQRMPEGTKEGKISIEALSRLNREGIKDIAKTIRKDAILADELYACAGHDMKLLAALIDDPESYTLDEIEERSNQLYPTDIGDVFCKRVMAKSPHAVHFVNKWMDSRDASHRSFAYRTLEELAKKNVNLANGFFRAHLARIAKTIKTEPPLVQNAMASAAESICKRCPEVEHSCHKVMLSIRQYAE